MKVLYIYFDAFSDTGGIQTFNRALLKAADELDREKVFEFKTISLFDSKSDNRYIRDSLFKGFAGNKIQFGLRSIYEAKSSDIVILGHINLASIGYLIKKLFRKKVYIMAYGTDVWFKMSNIREMMLSEADKVLSISEYTKQRIIDSHDVKPEDIQLFYCCLDPYFEIPKNLEKPKALMKKHGIDSTNTVLLTVSRLSAEEKYKGYDQVIRSLPTVLKEYPDTKYIIIGTGDGEEIERIENMIKDLNLEDNVILTGFVSNEELTDYYKLSDIFVMPSKGEGFGIVFLEALVFGKTIIAGNKDASKEVILDGEIGLKIDPDNIEQISTAILDTIKGDLRKDLKDKEHLKNRALEEFGFDKYKERLKQYVLHS